MQPKVGIGGGPMEPALPVWVEKPLTALGGSLWEMQAGSEQSAPRHLCASRGLSPWACLSQLPALWLATKLFVLLITFVGNPKPALATGTAGGLELGAWVRYAGLVTYQGSSASPLFGL